jgi:hypothetical protein
VRPRVRIKAKARVLRLFRTLAEKIGISAGRCVIRPGAVPLRTNLRQGNGKNLCRIAIPPNGVKTSAAQTCLCIRLIIYFVSAWNCRNQQCLAFKAIGR